VAREVRTGYLVQGAEVEALEREVGDSLGLPPGVAVSSGTAALHLALLALGIGPGDEVILPSYVCIAPLHAIEYVGAAPRLADIDPSDYSLDPADVRRRLTRRTRAIIVPHLFGLPADLDALAAFGIPLVEDCAQAVGARFGTRPVGSVGAVGILSFYATKLLTTGEGGMLVGRDRRLLSRIRDRRDYDERRAHALRFNYKLTDFQAALGRSQLRRLQTMLARRAALAARYGNGLRGLPIRLPRGDERRTHVFHRFVVSGRASARMLIGALGRRGVTARHPVFQPIHRTLGVTGFPGAEEAFRHAVSLPIYPRLAAREADAVIAALREALE
jgi:dTDP-4-amino-4,6-dideoxygalactose transaminase